MNWQFRAPARFAVIYFFALVAVTLAAVIFFGRLPDIVVVPLEYLLPLFPATIACRAYIRSRRQAEHNRRAREGLCPACGYDLRATAGRCAECGEMSQKA